MTTMARAPCPACMRPTALYPTRRAGFGSEHDHKVNPRERVLCSGSMERIPFAAATAWQLELTGEQTVAVVTIEAPTLF
ncbi:hypothetical protein [Streptomyces wedmorensis]|uniref:hypothetical protein n=1 Tax=Streptomyces wedmorensis TaxID=43759 RepID=UPI0037B79A87